MNQELVNAISLVVGFLLAFIVELPKVGDAYHTLGDWEKRGIMAVLLAVSAGVLYAVNCVPILTQVFLVFFPKVVVTCDEPGIVGLIQAWIFAIMSSQGAYSLFFKGRSPAQARVRAKQEIKRLAEANQQVG